MSCDFLKNTVIIISFSQALALSLFPPLGSVVSVCFVTDYVADTFLSVGLDEYKFAPHYLPG